MNGSGEIGQSGPKFANAILLAMEVWTTCGSVSDVVDRTSRWNLLAYGGITGLDKLSKNEAGMQDGSRRLAQRLSATWSAVMLHQQPRSKRAFFMSQPSTASSMSWDFLFGGYKVTVLQVLLPDQGLTIEDEIVLVNALD